MPGLRLWGKNDGEQGQLTSARREPRPPKGNFAGTTEHQLGNAEEQHPSADANGSPRGGA